MHNSCNRCCHCCLLCTPNMHVNICALRAKLGHTGARTGAVLRPADCGVVYLCCDRPDSFAKSVQRIAREGPTAHTVSGLHRRAHFDYDPSDLGSRLPIACWMTIPTPLLCTTYLMSALDASHSKNCQAGKALQRLSVLDQFPFCCKRSLPLHGHGCAYAGPHRSLVS